MRIMKNPILVISALVGLMCPALTLSAQTPQTPTQPRHVVMNESELRNFHSNVANRDYELYGEFYVL